MVCLTLNLGITLKCVSGQEEHSVNQLTFTMQNFFFVFFLHFTIFNSGLDHYASDPSGPKGFNACRHRQRAIDFTELHPVARLLPHQSQ